jgi:1,4-dihydroxy-2-naphthoate octaprenyltransferase
MKAWIGALRLRTLPLAISSILVGSALAHFHGSFSGTEFLLALLTAVLLQILSNLSNDLGDHLHGADNEQRIGPARSVQSGEITPAAMKRAMLLTALLAFMSGCWLIVHAFGLSLTMLSFLLIGLLALGAAVKYTFGRDPYGYAGFGDLAVFVFFGVVGVIGTYYLHTSQFDRITVMPAIAFGLLSAGVLNVNNLRDHVNDKAAGKRTMVVRLGFKRALLYHGILSFLPLLLLHHMIVHHMDGYWGYIFLIGYIPIGFHSYRVQSVDGKLPLDPELKRLALGTFATAVTLSIGLLLS